MSNAMESWSWEGCDGKRADVEVYARADSVALFLNGTEVGRKKLKNDCIARFRCTYQSGTLEAVSYDSKGKEIGRYALRSAGPETCLRALPEQPSVTPGGLSYIRLKYTDGAGLTKPLCRGKLKVEVDGGKLLGLGSACPYYELSYLGDVTDTYYGEALAVVQAGDGDQVTLTVSDGTYSTQAFVAIR
jgi:beta-galactosidase